MNRTSLPAPEQKEHARHGEQLFPLQKYITTLDDLHPSVSAHWHEEAEFTRILSGSGTYQIQLQHYDVAAGDLLFIPPALLHAITVTPREKLCTETYVFHMHFLGASTADICSVQYLTPLATAKLIPPFFFDARHPLHAALDDLFNDMDALHDAATPGYELLLKADFLRLIALLLPCCSAADEDTRLHMEYTAKLKTVLEYIDAHYAEELSIADLASLCYFSEYHFMRFFKRFMGTSCLNYIKNLRLEKAAELLGQDGLTPLDTSLSAGFHNLSYFYREFRKKYGVTPGNFRGAGAREK